MANFRLADDPPAIRGSHSQHHAWTGLRLVGYRRGALLASGPALFTLHRASSHAGGGVIAAFVSEPAVGAASCYFVSLCPSVAGGSPRLRKRPIDSSGSSPVLSRRENLDSVSRTAWQRQVPTTSGQRLRDADW